LFVEASSYQERKKDSVIEPKQSLDLKVRGAFYRKVNSALIIIKVLF